MFSKSEQASNQEPQSSKWFSIGFDSSDLCEFLEISKLFGGFILSKGFKFPPKNTTWTTRKQHNSCLFGASLVVSIGSFDFCLMFFGFVLSGTFLGLFQKGYDES